MTAFQNVLGDFGIVPAAVVTFLILLLTTVIFFFHRKFSAKPNVILIAGLSDSGKTLLFSKLINSENKWESYTSMTENVYQNYFIKDGSCCSLVDVPGAESLRKNLLAKWLVNERKTLKCIIFVVDSVTFGEKSKDVADLLYDVLFDSMKSIPVLVACNKQDNQLKAKSNKIIESELEKEFALINVSRAAALSSTNGDSTKKLLSKAGAEFNWAELKKQRVGSRPLISFTQCCAIEDGKKNSVISTLSLYSVRTWIDPI